MSVTRVYTKRELALSHLKVIAELHHEDRHPYPSRRSRKFSFQQCSLYECKRAREALEELR